jgi:pimeloyl-ACP methyl ester carboxylesterase
MKPSHAVRSGITAVAILLLSVISVVPRAMAQFDKSPAVKNIVLIHGAWADGSCWSKVIPILQAKGFHVVAVQLSLTSLADDVATTERALADQDGPVILVGHSYGGAVISEAGNDPKVAGLVYVAAFAPGDGESVSTILTPYPPAPVNTELSQDAAGFLRISVKGMFEDFGQDLSIPEKALLAPTQGPTASAALATNITTAAWKVKPTWFVIAANDRAIPPDLERAEAVLMHATSITLPSSHLAMLSHPREVAQLIDDAATDPRHR